MSPELVERIDRLVTIGVYPSRAAALIAATERLLADEERNRIDRELVDGYSRVPPTTWEIGHAEAAGRRSIADEPW